MLKKSKDLNKWKDIYVYGFNIVKVELNVI